jgi:hypothetical protein
MTLTKKQIVEAAMSLDEADREEVVDELLRSLDEPSRAEIESAWVEEIERREQQIERGESKWVPGEESLEALRVKHSK